VFTPFHKPPYPYLYGRSVDETTTKPILLDMIIEAQKKDSDLEEI
jgi:hypothetical protein